MTDRSPDDVGAFEPARDPGTSAGEPEFEPGNVCRAAGLAALTADRALLVEPLRNELYLLGFSDSALRGIRPTRDVFAVLNEPISLESGGFGDDERVTLWSQINEGADRLAAQRFLVALLASSLERESVAAAAALLRTVNDDLASVGFDMRQDFSYAVGPFDIFWDAVSGRSIDSRTWPPEDASAIGWRGAIWSDFVEANLVREQGIDAWRRVWLLSAIRVFEGSRSDDTITRQLAASSRLGPEWRDFPIPESRVELHAGPPAVSTLVHGTWGWKGDWWRPSGGFHRYILGDYRANLYAGGARYSWSGAYKADHRARAGEDLYDWAREMASGGLETVLAHSYGAEVAARAVIAGTTVSEFVLLSAPANALVNAAAMKVGRTVDVRLPLDPVLSLARVPQRLGLSVPHTLVLTAWRLDHSATHDERVWLDEAIGSQAGL